MLMHVLPRSAPRAGQRPEERDATCVGALGIAESILQSALRGHVLLLSEPYQACMTVRELRVTQQARRAAAELPKSPL
jgi:hypothetical protein